jgi:hypothetical protein
VQSAELSRKKITWVLGAGFSMPFGAPLFRELISRQTFWQVSNWPPFAALRRKAIVPSDYPFLDGASVEFELDVSVFAQVVVRLYQSGLGTDEGLRFRLWSDAEQFLEILEIAVAEPSGQLAKDVRKALEHVPRLNGDEADKAVAALLAAPDLHDVWCEAVRFVSGACTAFLNRAEQNAALVRDSELWSPYRRWARTLVPGSDSVVTFNYDRVLDLLSAAGPRNALASPVGRERDYFDALIESSAIVPMYHLHGHVGWLLRNGRVHRRPENPQGIDQDFPIGHEYPGEALLGVPGTQKTGLASGLFKELWERAMNAIAEASSIVFVGYRFPETDNVAKERLIDALRSNPTATVHIVLGANNKDTPRLKGMLEWTRPERKSVHVHEMWAQDFFAVFDRGKL